MVTADALIAQARTWVGVPFLHQGRTRQGVDCVGLAVAVGLELGLFDASIDRTDYGRLPTGGRLARELAARCKRLAKPQPGALLLMVWNREPVHVALCTGPTLIHALYTAGRVIEHGFRARWPERVVGSYWMPGVEA